MKAGKKYFDLFSSISSPMITCCVSRHNFCGGTPNMCEVFIKPLQNFITPFSKA